MRERALRRLKNNDDDDDDDDDDENDVVDDDDDTDVDAKDKVNNVGTKTRNKNEDDDDGVNDDDSKRRLVYDADVQPLMNTPTAAAGNIDGVVDEDEAALRALTPCAALARQVLFCFVFLKNMSLRSSALSTGGSAFSSLCSAECSGSSSHRPPVTASTAPE